MQLVAWLAVALAQTPTELGRDEYWRLRDRLASEFLTEGTAPGDAIPAVHRSDVLGYGKWADGTVQLGWYLGVLATEHALLSDPDAYPGFDAGRASALADTEQALYDALFALERLDWAGEVGYPCPPLPLLNGFFVRDDVPADHHTRLTGLTLTLSDSTDLALYNKEMSQDQVYHLLLGLALLTHLVPPDVEVQGQTLNPWAVELTDRIATKVIETDGWVIHNPVCDKDVDRGADARAYSGGTVQAVEYITGVAHDPALLDAWALMDNPLNPAYLNSDNLHMTMVIAAVGEGYDIDTLDVLLDLAAIHDWQLYPMLYATLHDATPHPEWATHQADLTAYARGALSELPAGADIASPRPGTAVHGWTSWNRYLRPAEDHYAGGQGTETQRYHGLDWMLLHNLLYTVDPTQWDVPEASDPTDPDPRSASGSRPPDEPAATGRSGGEASGCGCETGSPSGLWLLVPLLIRVSSPRTGRRRSPRSRSARPAARSGGCR